MVMLMGCKAVRLLLPAILILLSICKSQARLVVQRDPNNTIEIEVTQEEFDSAKKLAIQIRENETLALSQETTSVRPGETPGSIVAETRKIRDKDAAKESREAQINLAIAKEIARARGLSINKARYIFSSSSSIRLTRNSTFGNCHPEPQCEPFEKYRTFDGSCNNLDHPLWGKSHTAFSRHLDPDYADGIGDPRKAASGDELPSARIVSTVTTSNRNSENYRNTHMVMQFGQFVDHDLSHTPITEAEESNHGIICCRSARLHSACLPITIPSNDTFFGPFHERCMEFVRSAPVKPRDCSISPREQMNTLTSYIDGSNVYGSTESEARSLRTWRGGQLRVYLFQGRELLPPDYSVPECTRQRFPCFRAGDVRVNEQPNLAVMHTIWLREHNRIVTRLAQINPSWSDETLYQEGRRIVGAMLQHIIYNEYLPDVLGVWYMARNRLTPLTSGYVERTYDREIDASITNEFATAAYRYGHTLIQDQFKGFSSTNELVRNLTLSAVQFAPAFLYDETAIDDMLRGLFTQRCQNFDRNFATQLTNFLFARNASFGLDLVALNIQRGRDHGIPSYLAVREACGLRLVRRFSDLRSHFASYSDASTVERLYESVEDIDLFVGGSLERVASGALVGETFQCIIGEAFIRLKRGDRFYYEYGENPITRFTPRQLQEIRKISLARVLCDNSGLTEVPFDVFRIGGPTVQCLDIRKLPVIDLEQWREKEHYHKK